MKQLLILTIVANFWCLNTVALPPPEDIPEEILRTEIITEGRSPLDGKALNSAEYAELQEKLATPEKPIPVTPKLQELIFFMRIQDFFKTITPF